jgi:HTH-type transcriptional regulator / antitoxin HigA
MESTSIKYKVIKNADQYKEYCILLENLLSEHEIGQVQDEIDLLTLLIEKYDEDQNTFHENDPVSLLRSLNYKKGLSKEVIRKLAVYFKVRQEAFNRPYKLL